MKVSIIISLVFLYIASYSQDLKFSVDCGKDTAFCVSLYPNTQRFPLGEHVKISNGLAPYTYAWSIKPIRASSKHTSTASDYLNDTTIINPLVVGVGVENKPWRFYLTVTDSNNNVAKDSINVKFSRFVYSLLEIGIELHNGDSLQFTSNHYVNGGIPPIKYYWTPSMGLKDSSIINTWCKPERSTDYYQYIIDSAGCKCEPNRIYNITMLSTGVIEKLYNRGNQLNLKQYGNKVTFDNPHNKLAKVNFYSLNGEMLYSIEGNTSFFEVPSSVLKNNIIICKLFIEKFTSQIKYRKEFK